MTTPINPRRAARRGGFTLIEMLVVVTLFAFFLASVAVVIGTLFRAQGDLQDELAQASTMSRLAAQLRADAHRATSAAFVPDGSAPDVRLSATDGEVNYSTQPRRIIRTVIVGGEQTQREVFALLEGTTTDWQISGETPAFITLTTSYVSPELREGVARPRVHVVEASIGLLTGGVP